MKLYRTKQGAVLEEQGSFSSLPDFGWDDLFVSPDPKLMVQSSKKISRSVIDPSEILAPIQSQEVWAAGVTYYRSKEARREESKDSGGGSFYDRVYVAERPELFFKSTPHRVAGHLQEIKIRSDSAWNVPEPELTLVLNSSGKIFGYTCGNDVSSRSIEGENPLYLPQAKIYDKSCALGPCLFITDEPLSTDTEIALSIVRGGAEVFQGKTTLAAIKRAFTELVSFLFRENSFPSGCFLLTGTGIVPEDTFTLQSGDVCHIAIGQIGTLTNIVA
jgi:2-dehydro-3-deoxy-D-arabinonate dehydratase